MLTLYDYLPSQNAWKVRQLLAHLQRPYRTQLVSIFEGEGSREAFRAISPAGTMARDVTSPGPTSSASVRAIRSR